MSPESTTRREARRQPLPSRRRIAVPSLVLGLAVLLAAASTAPASASPYPNITKLSPSSYSPAGGATITLMGSGFATGDSVTFSAARAGSTIVTECSVSNPVGCPVEVEVISPTQMTAVIPPDPDPPNTALPDRFTVHVKLPDSDGTVCAPAVGYCGESNLGSHVVLFSYTGAWGQPPSIDPNGLSPNPISPLGGQKLTITGANFTATASVLFNNMPSGTVTVSGPQVTVGPGGTSLTVLTPGDSGDGQLPRAVSVQVHTVAGTSAGAPLTIAWAKGGAPKITGVNPGDGDPAGNQAITISGQNLGGTSGQATVTLTYSVPLQPQTCGPCDAETAAFTGVKVVQKGGQIQATTPDVKDFPTYPPADQQPLPPGARFAAAVPQDATLTVITDSGTASTKFHLDDCGGPPDANPIHALLNSIFSIPSCNAVGQGFVTWMLQEPDVAGDLHSASAEQHSPTAVVQLESVTAGIALGLLALVFTVSLVRFTVGAVAAGNPGTVIQGIVQPAGAALLVIAWPQIYTASVTLADTITNGIANGPINLEAVPTLLLFAMFALALGVGSFLGGIGLIIGILFVIAGVALFFALIALKLTLFALMTVVYVGMPLLAVISRVPTYDWVFSAALRAWGIGLIWPIGWALILACAGAVFVDAWNLDQGGDLVKLVGQSIVSVILLAACVKMPGMMMRVALRGTGLEGGARSIGGALVLNHFLGKALAAGGAAVGVPPWLTGIAMSGGGRSLPELTAKAPAAMPAPGTAAKLFDEHAYQLRHSADRGRDVEPQALAQAFGRLDDAGLAHNVYDQSFARTAAGNAKAHFVLAEAYEKEWSKTNHGDPARLDALVRLGAAPLENLREGYELFSSRGAFTPPASPPRHRPPTPAGATVP
jgi:hypothetical protein